MWFYCILRDECGEEYGIKIIAHDLSDCLDILRESYPESSVVDVRRY